MDQQELESFMRRMYLESIVGSEPAYLAWDYLGWRVPGTSLGSESVGFETDYDLASMTSSPITPICTSPQSPHLSQLQPQPQQRYSDEQCTPYASLERSKSATSSEQSRPGAFLIAQKATSPSLSPSNENQNCRKEKRRAQNRLAQQIYRQRKQAKIELGLSQIDQLSERLHSVEGENESLRSEMNRLQVRLTSLQKENMALGSSKP